MPGRSCCLNALGSPLAYPADTTARPEMGHAEGNTLQAHKILTPVEPKLPSATSGRSVVIRQSDRRTRSGRSVGEGYGSPHRQWARFAACAQARWNLNPQTGVIALPPAICKPANGGAASGGASQVERWASSVQTPEEMHLNAR